MKSLQVFIHILLIINILPNFTLAQTHWETYCNARFGYCLDYPTELIPQAESENGDGRYFISKDKKVVLIVWGSLDIEEGGLSPHIAKAYDKEYKITYKTIKKDWAVISGYTQEGKIFYDKIFYLNGYFYTFKFEYPTSLRKTYDPLCKKLADSFVMQKD
jgi:hypothetical protein